jgi:PleD family two-component response regulator
MLNPVFLTRSSGFASRRPPASRCHPVRNTGTGPFMHPVPTKSTVLLVDDQPFMRKGIRSVPEAYEDIHIVGEARDGLEAIQYARMLKPHVVLMDINMPQMDGIQAARIIKEEDPETIIVGLSIWNT